MTRQELLRAIRRLDADMPRHKDLEHAFRDGADYGAWYKSQKEHWIGWLSEYDGPGAYGRQSGRGKSAEYIYNHIQCAPMLLWLAEALDFPEAQIEQAYTAAINAPRRNASQCAALRKVIPWQEVEPAISAISKMRRRRLADVVIGLIAVMTGRNR